MKYRLIIATCPKPFDETFGPLQINAIKSWIALIHPNISTEIWLLGHEQGVEETANLLNCKWSDVEYNKYGTPLVSDIFKKLVLFSDNSQSIDNSTSIDKSQMIEIPILCYVNCDIILFNCFLANIWAFHEKFYGKKQNKLPYMLVGCRWDVDDVPIVDDFSKSDWVEKLIDEVLPRSRKHDPGGIDYFVFSPQTFKYIYPFALGKFVWDRWLVGNVYRRDSITVDLTATNFVIHQNADWYQASQGGKTRDREALYKTEEVIINHTFDYYEKDVISGTRWETVYDDDKIKFIEK